MATPRPRIRISLVRIVVLAALVAGGLLALQGGKGVRWKSLATGFEFATVRGEPFCRRGSAEIAVLRIAPERFRVGVRHYREFRDNQPPGILEWQRRTGAMAVFNAGQYYPDYDYMGLLVSNGRAVSQKAHPEFQAALVADRRGRKEARVLDLAATPLDLDDSEWSEVAQSFMLFDRSGMVRVRKSDRVANRTIVAEDRGGRLLVIATEGGYTLHELAQLLRDGPLNLSHAMSMDGGTEAKLCVKRDGFSYTNFGPWNGQGISIPGADVPLPAVITVMPR